MAVIGLITVAVAIRLSGDVAELPTVQRSDTSPRVDEIRDDKLLSLESRQLLWEIEHIAFTVEQKVFPEFKRTLLQNDTDGLVAFMSDDFTGTVPSATWSEVIERGPVVAWFATPAESGGRSLDARSFAEELMRLRQQFDADAESCRLSMGLVRLNPVVSGELGGSWEGVWRLVIRGSQGGRRREMWITLGVQLDSLDDQIATRQHWIRSATLDSVWLAESPGPLLEEITATTGIDTARLVDNWTSGAVFNPVSGGVYLADYDRDGVLDMLVEDSNVGGLLYRGLGDGTFRDVTSEVGLAAASTARPLWTLSCWADLDGDGDEDLIVGEALYENLGDGTFRDVTELSNLALAPAEGYAVADYDRDGQVDLYVCHSAPFLPGQTAPEKVEWIDGGLGVDNVLWRNLGDWQFEDVSEASGTGGGGSACFTAVWFDANNDLNPDLLAINEFGRNSLLLNRGDGAFDETTIDPIFGGFSMGATAGDFDNDGISDLYVANMYSKAGNRILANVFERDYPAGLFAKVREATTGNKLYRSLGDGRFSPLPSTTEHAEVGWAYGPNFVDLDGDGFLDLYVTAGFQSVARGKPDG